MQIFLQSSLQRKVTEDLRFHDYKVELIQELKPNERAQQKQLLVKHQKINGVFSKKINFSDEKHVYLDGFVNRQNCHIRGSENPHTLVEKQIYRKRATVW